MANFNKYFKRELPMKNHTKHYYNMMLCGVSGLCVRHVLMAHNESVKPINFTHSIEDAFQTGRNTNIDLRDYIKSLK